MAAVADIALAVDVAVRLLLQVVPLLLLLMRCVGSQQGRGQLLVHWSFVIRAICDSCQLATALSSVRRIGYAAHCQ